MALIEANVMNFAKHKKNFQNNWTSFNNTWHKVHVSMFEGNISLIKCYPSPFPRENNNEITADTTKTNF